MRTPLFCCLLLSALCLAGCAAAPDDRPAAPMATQAPTVTPAPTATYCNQPPPAACADPNWTPAPTAAPTATPVILTGKPSDLCYLAKKAKAQAPAASRFNVAFTGKACLRIAPYGIIITGGYFGNKVTISFADENVACDTKWYYLDALLPMGDQPGQMKQLPDRFQESDLEIFTQNGSIRQGQLARVTGRLIIRRINGDETCIVDEVQSIAPAQ